MSIRPLSPENLKRAIEELTEVPERVEDDLKDIEEWLSKQAHLSVRKDRQWLIAFLRNAKFSLQRTKEKIDYFYTIKTITPEYFMKKDPMLPELQRIMNTSFIVPLLKTTEQANVPAVFFLQWKHADPNKMNFIDLFKFSLMSIDLMLYKYDHFTVAGVYIIHDMTGFSLSYVTHLTPALCKKAMLSITNAYPCRIRGIYFMNTPAIYETFINMFKPFMVKKIQKRLKVFREEDFDKLYEEVPSHVFPKEYSGVGQSTDELAAEWKSIMEEHRDWLVEDDKYFSDESKRPGKPKTSADIYGIEGSFRKLNVD